MPRFLKSAYRKEPISSFILIVGAVDAVIGGVGERWTLLSFGVVMVLVAIALRYLQLSSRQPSNLEETPVRYLPAAPTSPPIPQLRKEKRRSSY